MRRLALAPTLVAVAALALAGCAQDVGHGPAGRVTGETKDGKKFYLVVEPKKEGKEKKFRVISTTTATVTGARSTPSALTISARRPSLLSREGVRSAGAVSQGQR